MQLHENTASPFVRKVLVCAHETGLADRLEPVPERVSPARVNAALAAGNPIGKIPALVLDYGTALYDSRVVCEYLDTLHDGPRLFPAPPARWTALRRQALADGLLDAAVLIRYETIVRPQARRWNAWIEGQMAKIGRVADAILAEFSSAVAAVDSAVEIQTELDRRNAGLADDQKLEIRIGINVGDVIEDRGEVFGDGANLAARLEAAAPAGGICISANVHEQIAGKVAVAFEDAGEASFKNIVRPVRIYRWSVCAPRVVPGDDAGDRGELGAAVEIRREGGAPGRLGAGPEPVQDGEEIQRPRTSRVRHA